MKFTFDLAELIEASFVEMYAGYNPKERVVFQIRKGTFGLGTIKSVNNGVYLIDADSGGQELIPPKYMLGLGISKKEAGDRSKETFGDKDVGNFLRYKVGDRIIIKSRKQYFLGTIYALKPFIFFVDLDNGKKTTTYSSYIINKAIKKKNPDPITDAELDKYVAKGEIASPPPTKPLLRTPPNPEPDIKTEDVTEAEGYKVGDRVVIKKKGNIFYVGTIIKFVQMKFAYNAIITLDNGEQWTTNPKYIVSPGPIDKYEQPLDQDGLDLLLEKKPKKVKIKTPELKDNDTSVDEPKAPYIDVKTPASAKELQRLYKYYNKKVFGNKLPDIKLGISTRAQRFHGVAKARRSPTGRYSNMTILISKFNVNNPKVVIDTLLHEMIHIWQYHMINETGDQKYIRPSRSGRREPHGQYFKEWMRKLNSMGFDIDVRSDVDASVEMGETFYGVVVYSKPPGARRSFATVVHKEMDLTRHFQRIIDHIKSRIRYEPTKAILFKTTNPKVVSVSRQLNNRLQISPTVKRYYADLKYVDAFLDTQMTEILKEVKL